MNRLMALLIIVPLMFTSPFAQASKIHDGVSKTPSGYKTDQTENKVVGHKRKHRHQADHRDPPYVPDRPEQKKPLKNPAL